MFLIIACLLIIEVALLQLGIPDYFSFILPIPIAAALYISQFRTITRLHRIQITLFLALLISVSLFMPPTTAFLSYRNVLSQASNKSDTEKASFISSFIANTDVDVSCLPPMISEAVRANNNLKYFTSGVGACGEMAISTSALLNQLGLNARIVNFPGEDHEFVEVNLNGTWFVLDPGYYQGQILTREQRADKRLTEMGAISYVIAYVNSSSFVELTQDYVPTDTIIINVVNSSEPVVNAQVYLEHTFLGATWRFPDATHVFYSNQNGSVTLHMGALDYNSNAGTVDRFYRIYVNGQFTPFTVTSTGSNQTQTIEIDLAKLH